MQTFEDDDVVIKHEKNHQKKSSKKNNKGSKTSKRKSHKNKTEKDLAIDKKLEKQIRIISVLLFVFSVFLLLALISYSPKDEAATEISFSEIFRLIGGDIFVKAKFENTNNWLGVFGAIIADFFNNYTFGYLVIFLPVFIALWSKDLFLKFSINRDLARRTALYLIFLTLFASFIGVMRHFSWTSEIPREWSGAVGQFVAAVSSDIIGNIGTLLLIIAATLITIIFGTDIDLNKYLNRINLSASPILQKIKIFMIKLKTNIQGNDSKDNDSEVEVIKIKESDTLDKINKSQDKLIINKRNIDADKDLEPATIIKRNLNLMQNNIEHHQDGNFDEKNAEIKHKKDDEKVNLEDDIPNQNPIVKQEQPESQESPLDILEKKLSELHHNPESVESDSDVKLSETNQINRLDIVKDDLAEKSKKPLTVTVKDTNEESEYIQENPLSTSIHDKKINYKPPSVDLLIEEKEVTDVRDEELSENAKILREKLETFKIEIDNLSVTPGPVVTQYEFVPAPGIKISKIENLSDDIAMALKAKGIRIIAPIPGRGTVGIEIPNRNPSIVRFSSIIKSSKFHHAEHILPLAFGKTIGGDVYIVDLAKMPHLLIAGSTGSGKSVGINTIIASLLYKKHPSELKFVIIDPKKVELNQYSILEKHFLATSPDIEDMIITSPDDAIIILKSLCLEMDNRYDILAEVGQRNIADYNKKVRIGQYKSNKDMVHRQMPYIVVIIDELADLMLTAGKEVEEPIIRLAQLARAVGIHLVLATQRPSVNVITGIIKANFPARASYLVASKVDSRTILDQSGAEQLLGNGDMLFLHGGSPKPVRVQNSFINTDEIEKICEFIGNQKGYASPYMLPSLIEKRDGMGIAAEDRDPLFKDAAKLLINLQQGSVSVIQRRLKVGYARAGRIIDELEDAGVVGPFDGSKARIVLMDSESDLERIL